MANGVTVDLIVDPKKAIQGLAEVERKSSGLANTLGGLGRVAKAGLVALGVATTAVAAATTAFVVSSVNAAAEAEKISAQTTAVITSTGKAAGKSAQQIDQLAKSLSRTSGVNDELIKSSENVLLTFTAIKGVNFDKASQAVLDLSVSMGKDLQSSAILVGKALNDPIKGLTALTRVGVRFTDQQRQQIAAMVKAGDVAGAQAVILRELNTEFGGSAAAFGNTFLGAVGKAKTALEELKEQVGGALLPVLTAGATSVAGVFNAISDNPKFKAFIEGLGTKLTNGLKPFTDLLTAAASSDDPFGTLLDGLEKISPVLGVVRDVFDALKPVLPQIQAGFAQIGSALASGLVQYGPQLAQAFGEIVTAIVPLIPQILTLIPPLLQLAITVVPPLVTVLQALVPILDFIVQGFSGGLQAVSAFFGLLSGNTTLQGFQQQVLAIKGPVGDLAHFATDLGTNIANFISGLVTNIRNFFGGLTDLGKSLIDAGRNLIQGFLGGINDAWKFVQKAIRNLFGGVVDLVKKVLGIHSPSTVFAGIGSNLVAGLERGLSGPNNLGAIMSGISAQVTDGFQGSISATARATVATAGSDSGTGSVVVVDPESRSLMRALIKAVGGIQPGFIVPESLSQINQVGSSRLAAVGAS